VYRYEYVSKTGGRFLIVCKQSLSRDERKAVDREVGRKSSVATNQSIGGEDATVD